MKTNKVLLAAAVAGILGAAGAVHADDMKMDKSMGKGAKTSDSVHCYGVNSCSGKGKCGGPGGASCAGTNKCKGQGWLPMPKDSCTAIDGGSTEPKEMKK